MLRMCWIVVGVMVWAMSASASDAWVPEYASGTIPKRCESEKNFGDKIICFDAVLSMLDLEIAKKFDKMLAESPVERHFDIIRREQGLYKKAFIACSVPDATSSPTRQQYWTMAPCLVRQLKTVLADLGGRHSFPPLPARKPGVIHPLCVMFAGGALPEVWAFDENSGPAPTSLQECEAGLGHIPVFEERRGEFVASFLWYSKFYYEIIENLPKGGDLVLTSWRPSYNHSFSGFGILKHYYRGNQKFVSLRYIDEISAACVTNKFVPKLGSHIIFDVNESEAEIVEMMRIRSLYRLNGSEFRYCGPISIRNFYDYMRNENKKESFFISKGAFKGKSCLWACQNSDEAEQVLCIRRIFRKWGIDKHYPLSKLPILGAEIDKECRDL